MTPAHPGQAAHWQLASGIIGPNGHAINQNGCGAFLDGVPLGYLPSWPWPPR